MSEQRQTKSLKFIRNIFLLVLFHLSMIPSFGQEGGVMVDEIISKVDNYIVLKSDLERAYMNYLSSGNSASSQAKCGILAQLISGKLMVAKAEIDSVEVSDALVDNNLDRRMQIILSQYGGSEEQLEQYYGKSLDDIKEDIRDDVKEQLTVETMQNEIIKDLKVTPAEVKKFFAKIPKDSLPYFSTEVEVGQIVRIPTISAESKNELKLKLNLLKKRAEAGESFEALAREYSQGPSAKYGGNLGFAQRGAMAPKFEANALKLKPNQISDAFETEFGIHIVQLIERRGNEYNSRHIILIPDPSEADIKRTSNSLDSIRQLIVRDSITFEKAAKEFSEDKRTAGSGGFFTDSQGGFKISVEDLDPVIFFTIDSMQVGDISKPVKFRRDDGKEAVRILYYKSKVSPHQANLKQDWQKIQAATLNEKKSRILSEWFDKARNDVFISIDDTYDYCGILN
ncbi:peptidylprolyl isomerase [Fulvivirga lutea]|uniref:Peptidylprolyl isomerase n=2 Tax=Fulvivirga lutea TaxID=2810512 RepID=A0A974WJN4_9BACT|nr:peptidylprolyl isomerase [Fulvivirga lutea]